MSNYVPEAFNHNQRGTEVSTYTDLYGGLGALESTSTTEGYANCGENSSQAHQ